jgi:NAD(P)H-hydrate epimerase
LETSIPSLTTGQMVDVDRLMIDVYGIQLVQMMENAGANLAKLARRMLGGDIQSRQIAMLCGAGNNGGGGMVAARHLSNWGAEVQVKLVADPARLKEAPAHQWRILEAMQLAGNYEPDLEACDLVIDAILGYGLAGDPRGQIADWITRINTAGRPSLALDVPSGLDASTGIPGAPCLRATATLTLAMPKTGLLVPSALPYVGALYLADIGVPPALYDRLGIQAPPIFAYDSIVEIPTS